jgi:hypothetical protein
MPLDPITRTARRQTAIDRVAEHLVEWGAPPEHAPDRALLVLETLEAAGWHLAPWLDDTPLRGRGSTPEGRARARRELAETLAARRERAAQPLSAPLPR